MFSYVANMLYVFPIFARLHGRKKVDSDSESEGSCDEEEDDLPNTFVVIGKVGCGATAAVYACAQELGYKVY